MFIELFVTVCLSLSQPGSCVTELVTNSSQNDMSMTGCLGVEGELSVQKFITNHPLYHGWNVKGWSCKVGNQPPAEKGRA